MIALEGFAQSGFDGVALKPTEIDLDRVTATGIETVVIDYEGREHVPDATRLAELTTETTLRVTTPVRADGFDPLGDDHRSERLPTGVERILVAGNPAYLTETERKRAVGPRLGAARERTPDAWVGTEGVERLALAAGGTQFELLAPTTAHEVRALRAAGFEGSIAVYAPVVRTDDEDTLLDALGAYVARRGSVAGALDDARSERTERTAVADGAPTDATANGQARSILLNAIEEFALVGQPERIDERIEQLRAVGVDTIVGYPARGPDAVGR
ncbi:luciferase [Halococcus sp. PRR34]|uniref:DUF7388 family protein n=1 Tax=Halococcus sp. PRR34 TaxID=3020830 RepID=UPI00235FA54C|nr:luciferase [Halococcus sp. PRR34]